MVEKEIGEYAILSPAKLDRDTGNYKLVIMLLDRDLNHIANMYYLPDEDALPESSVDARDSITMYKHVSQAAVDIDILRNESPVYAVYRSPTLAWIQTGSEPIGEGELVA